MADYSEEYNLRVSLQDSTVKAELAEIDKILQDLDHNKVTISISANTSKVMAELTALKTLTEELDHSKISLGVDSSTLKSAQQAQKIATEQARTELQTVKAIGQARKDNASVDLANTRASRVANQENLDSTLATSRARKLDAGTMQTQVRTLNTMLNAQRKLESSAGNFATTFGKGMNTVSTVASRVSSISSSLSQASLAVAKPLLAVGGVGAGILGVGIASQLAGAIKYETTVESAKAQLKAQGLTAKEVGDIYQNEIVPFANNSPFDIANLTQGVSAVNSYVGDIKKATRATKVFGTSLFASGKSAEDLNQVAVNLGQLSTGNFTKTDFNQLVKGVPAISQALRDININGWEDFNKALGDNPNTKVIERTGNALDFVTNALDKYNVKTNALVEANKPIKAQLENMVGQYQTMRSQVLENSGAYDAFGRIIQATQKKLASPEVANALTNLFKGSVPLMDKAVKAINDFNIDKFINGITTGFDKVKSTISGIVNSPIIKSLKNMFTSGLGLKGDEGDFGKIISGFITNGLKLGIAGISLKGLKLGATGISGVTGILGSIGTTIGKVMSASAKGRVSKQISQQLQTVLTSEVGQGLEQALAGLNTKTSGGFFSGTGKFGTFTKGLAQLGGGLAGLGLGGASLAGATWLGSKSIQEVVNTIGKINDSIPSSLPEINGISSKINNLVKWSAELAKINVSGDMGSIATGLSTGLTTIGGIVTALGASTGNVGLVGGGLATAGIGVLVQGVQILGTLNEGLKLNNIKKLVELPAKLNAIPDMNGEDVAKKITTLKTSISKMRDALTYESQGGSTKGQPQVMNSLASDIDWLGRAFENVKVDKVAKSFKDMNNLTTQLNKVGDINVVADKTIKGLDNLKTAIGKIKSSKIFSGQASTAKDTDRLLQNLADAQNGTQSLKDAQSPTTINGTDVGLDGMLAQFQKMIEPLTSGKINVDGITKSIGKLNTLAQAFNTMPEIKTDGMADKMNNVMNLVKNMISAFSSNMQGTQEIKPINSKWFDAMTSSVTKLLPVINQINQLQIPNMGVNMTAVIRVIGQMKQAFSSIDDQGADVKPMNSKWFDAMTQSVNKLLPIINQINALQIPNLDMNLQALTSVIQRMRQAFSEQTGGETSKPMNSQWFDAMTESINKLLPIVNQINSLDITNVDMNLQMLTSVIQRMRQAFSAQTGGETSQPMNSDWFDAMTESINKLIPVVNQINSLQIPNLDANLTMITQTIQRLRTAFAVGAGGDSAPMNSGQFDSMLASLDKLFPVIQKIQSMDFSGVLDKIEQMKQVIQSLSTLGQSGGLMGVPDFSSVVNQIQQIGTAIDSVVAKAGGVMSLGQSFTTLSQNVDVARGSIETLKGAIDSLPTSKTITITVIDNATATLNQISSLLAGISSKTVTVTTLHEEKGKAIGGVVGNTVAQMQRGTVSGNNPFAFANFAKGGMVSSMFGASRKTLKLGQDTVHALLSQGEAVLRRSTVSKVTPDFVDSLNNGKLMQAYQTLGNRLSTIYNQTMNNQTYNNSPSLTQNFYGNQQPQDRFLKQQLKGIKS